MVCLVLCLLVLWFCDVYVVLWCQSCVVSLVRLVLCVYPSVFSLVFQSCALFVLCVYLWIALFVQCFVFGYLVVCVLLLGVLCLQQCVFSSVCLVVGVYDCVFLKYSLQFGLVLCCSSCVFSIVCFVKTCCGFVKYMLYGGFSIVCLVAWLQYCACLSNVRLVLCFSVVFVVLCLFVDRVVFVLLVCVMCLHCVCRVCVFQYCVFSTVCLLLWCCGLYFVRCVQYYVSSIVCVCLEIGDPSCGFVNQILSSVFSLVLSVLCFQYCLFSTV